MKLIRDFPFEIPQLVNKNTKIATTEKEEGVEYYSPLEQLELA